MMTKEDVVKRLREIADRIDNGELIPVEVHNYTDLCQQMVDLEIRFYNVTNAEEPTNV